jgi:hypothetical protein
MKQNFNLDDVGFAGTVEGSIDFCPRLAARFAACAALNASKCALLSSLLAFARAAASMLDQSSSSESWAQIFLFLSQVIKFRRS